MFLSRFREFFLLPGLEWIGPEMRTLTTFSVLAGSVVVCYGGDLLPFVLCYLVGLVLVLGFTVCVFLRRYSDCEDRLDEIETANFSLCKLVDELEECERKLDACHSKERKSNRTLMAIKKALECSIILDLPKDPVITSTGHIYSLGAMNEYCWRSTNGLYRCPNTRMNLRPENIMRCYPLEHVCEEIRAWEEA